MRHAILSGPAAFDDFVVTFLKRQHPGGRMEVPAWALDALDDAGIDLTAL